MRFVNCTGSEGLIGVKHFYSLKKPSYNKEICKMEIVSEDITLTDM